MNHNGFQMNILDKIGFPPMIRVRQKLEPARLQDVQGAILGQIRALAPQLSVRPGQSVALACPSRGLADYVGIVKSIVVGLKELKLKPFIVPAMGSHGAATAKGQKKVLERLGITESAVGAPIRSNMKWLTNRPTISPYCRAMALSQRPGCWCATYIMIQERLIPGLCTLCTNVPVISIISLMR